TNSNDGDITGLHEVTYDVNNTADALILQLDSSKNIQWQKCYGGSGFDAITSVGTADRNLVFQGITTSFDGDITYKFDQFSTDIWLCELGKTNVIKGYNYFDL